MSVLKRALIQVRANIGKSILILLIFTMTMAGVSAKFMVSRMYDNTVNELFSEGVVPVVVYPKEDVSIFGNIEYSDENMPEYITMEQQKQIAKLEDVESYQTNIGIPIPGDQFQYPDSFSDEWLDTSHYLTFGDDPEKLVNSSELKGYKFDYDKNAYTSDPNSIILNDELLAENGLEVGDKITLNLNSEYSENEEIPELNEQELTIVGSYSFAPTEDMIEDAKVSAAESDYEPDLNFTNSKVQILLPLAKGEELATILGDDLSNIYYKTTYNLSSLSVKDKFASEVEALVGYEVETVYDLVDSEQEDMANSMYELNYLQSRFGQIVYVVVLMIIILLSVIITMFIRGRKKEIGILVALGESKRNIFSQLLIEQFILLIIATLIEYPALLIYSSSIAQENGALPLGFDLIPFGQTLIAGFIVIGIVVVIPAIYTLRLKPKKILL